MLPMTTDRESLRAPHAPKPFAIPNHHRQEPTHPLPPLQVKLDHLKRMQKLPEMPDLQVNDVPCAGTLDHRQ